MNVKPNPWHLLEIGEHEGTVFRAVKISEECTCTPAEPCQTLQLYYDHPVLPAGVPHGIYRIRTNAFGRLDLQRGVKES